DPEAAFAKDLLSQEDIHQIPMQDRALAGTLKFAFEFADNITYLIGIGLVTLALPIIWTFNALGLLQGLVSGLEDAIFPFKQKLKEEEALQQEVLNAINAQYENEKKL